MRLAQFQVFIVQRDLISRAAVLILKSIENLFQKMHDLERIFAVCFRVGHANNAKAKAVQIGNSSIYRWFAIKRR